MITIRKIALRAGLAALALLLIALLFQLESWQAPLAVGSAITLAFGLGAVPSLKNYQYTAWIIVAIVCGMLYPAAFLSWGDLDLRNPWLILIVVQLVMFGMGTQMSFRDFTNIRSMGKGVLVGILCQFSIMPVVGFTLTRIFHFDPEIAAGIVLIGSCSSGLASNVMVYLAGANLTLSVTLTAVATLLAPIMTPLLMKILAGTYVEVHFLDMCIQIIKIVIVPIGAAMLYDLFKSGPERWIRIVNIIFIIAVIWLTALTLGLWDRLASSLSVGMLTAIELISFLGGAVIAGKLYYLATTYSDKVRGFMPMLSMFGIVYFTLVTTAASRENILTVGLLMLLVSILHNSLGYTFGYWISRALGLDRDSCQTVALEVGLQNGGMASGLAGVMGKLATLGLAAAVFSPWMNISGSILGNYWRRQREKRALNVEDAESS
ncbi:bile acid:sodium symporter family protein [Flavilitoribacter nigricans]|uniref:Bile acid:sodium symporter n=1 Tax=Flavilitoribacter nigricans (strain ATCC 23147 / DSM 23189 / NBRC 102662 / NCIMB 1420 / SS-2) TaxID=1122177 RepID=A0A2D0N1T9_FLAN2|nr:bile acid:sodium symporter family protein [Flavilitoribacter nigricans]PHN02427.1 bile acid:sodium symporter [Flavilitoribacter nigricans DSM 23189 = NBRC 102662]